MLLTKCIYMIVAPGEFTDVRKRGVPNAPAEAGTNRSRQLLSSQSCVGCHNTTLAATMRIQSTLASCHALCSACMQADAEQPGALP